MANPIAFSLPSKYAPGTATASTAPSVEWLTGTWTVTHSTLAMWRDARNVRISYAPLADKGDGRLRIDDLVEYEPINKTAVRKSVAGVDTQAANGTGWDWRGKGWLFFVGSHWEVLGWGEEEAPDGTKEKWAVTWFAPTVFTKEGIDVYSDKKEGVSEGLYQRISEALTKIGAKELVQMVEKDMRPVEIKLPWTEK